MLMKKLGVLLHKNEAAFRAKHYLISLLMQVWEEMGITVEVIRGTDRFVPVDMIIPHVDLTITPREYREFLSHYPVVLNRRVVDISKSTISSNILRERDTYTGPVIVKTDRNYGGLPEKSLLPERRTHRSTFIELMDTMASKLWRIHSSHLLWRHVRYLTSSSYPVFSSLSRVPKGILANRNLVVEKFLPEIQGNMYCVRYYYCCGDHDMNFLARSQDPVIKGANILDYEEAPTPQELYAIRQRLGVDYGRFDYVFRDGKVVLFDVNRTPAYDWFEEKYQVAPHLAAGIRSWISTRSHRMSTPHATAYRPVPPAKKYGSAADQENRDG
jgi:hypothetical protein